MRTEREGTRTETSAAATAFQDFAAVAPKYDVRIRALIPPIKESLQKSIYCEGTFIGADDQIDCHLAHRA